MPKLKELIRASRLERGLAATEFASLLGKSAGYVSKIEVRGEIPSLDLLCDIADILKIDPGVLFELAKQDQLQRAERDLDTRYTDALELYRKSRQQ